MKICNQRMMMVSEDSQRMNIQEMGKDLNINPTMPDDLMTVSEVASFLKVRASWVYERTRRTGIERIPHVKLGKYLRFSMFEIQGWLKNQCREG